MITFGRMEDLSHEQHPRPGYMWRQSSAVKTYVLVPSTELGVTISESGHAAQWSLEQLEAGAGDSDWTWNVSHRHRRTKNRISRTGWGVVAIEIQGFGRREVGSGFRKII